MRWVAVLSFLFAGTGVAMAALGSHFVVAENLAPTSEPAFELRLNWLIASMFLIVHSIAAGRVASELGSSVPGRFAALSLLFGGASFAVGVWSSVLGATGHEAVAFLSIVSPFGGILMLAGWLLAAFAAATKKKA